MKKVIRFTVVMLAVGMLSGCSAMRSGNQPGTMLERSGDEIMVCGQLFHTGAPVVLWTDPGGYDAYRIHRHFDPSEIMPAKPVDPSSPARYSSFRRHLPPDVEKEVKENGWSLPLLQDWVDLFVMHYDVCGTSETCFRVLHDSRGLSVHFMLDLDGTIYQTCDLKERAWHAGTANDRSVGIEIANMGAYQNMDVLDKWYAKDEDGNTYITLPESRGDGGIRTPDFVGRPSRNEPVVGNIQGTDLMQYDLTDEQYDSLTKLVATVCTALPRINCDYPRDEDGNLITKVLTDEQMENFHGVLGHYHITTRKIDPGPAFDWDRIMDGAQEEMY